MSDKNQCRPWSDVAFAQACLTQYLGLLLYRLKITLGNHNSSCYRKTGFVEERLFTEVPQYSVKNAMFTYRTENMLSENGLKIHLFMQYYKGIYWLPTKVFDTL